MSHVIRRIRYHTMSYDVIRYHCQFISVHGMACVLSCPVIAYVMSGQVRSAQVIRKLCYGDVRMMPWLWLKWVKSGPPGSSKWHPMRPNGAVGTWLWPVVSGRRRRPGREARRSGSDPDPSRGSACCTHRLSLGFLRLMCRDACI